VSAHPSNHDDLLAFTSRLVLEDGRYWGDAAAPWQWTDAEEILRDDRIVRNHFLTRPRGASKTTDLAAIALTVMMTQAPGGAKLYALAADRGQGRLLLDSIEGFVQRTQILTDVFEVTAFRASVRATNVTLEVLAADAPGAWGLRPYFIVVDELAQWAETDRSLRLYEAMTTATGKLNGRMAILTTAGDPVHWAARIREHARADPTWRLHEVPGPVPWAQPDWLAAQKRALTDSAYRRLHMNEWVEADDRLASLEEVRACVTHTAPLRPVRHMSYIVGVDMGITNDRAAVALCHLESRDNDGYGVVVDDVQVWKGTRASPVQISDVKQSILVLARTYGDVRVLFDPHEAIGLGQDLRAAGLRADAYNFSQRSVGILASTLIQLFRNGAIALPDLPELIHELARVRIRETSPGYIRLDHDPGDHDDQAIAVALAAQALLERPPSAGPRIRALC
jgi:hypothetical protein